MEIDLSSVTGALRAAVGAGPEAPARIPVLAVELRFEVPGPVAVLTLSLADPDGAPADPAAAGRAALGGMTAARHWRCRFESGPDGRPPDLAAILTPSILSEIAALLAALAIAPGRPLWLDLRRPYGLLGAAPWDDRLAAALDRAVLRLPDLLQPPRENAALLEAALLFDPHPEIAPAEAIRQAVACVDVFHRASERDQTRVHVFAAGRWANALRDATFAGPTEVHRHPKPPSARERRRGGAARGNPWADWIARALRGRSLDAISFVCRASCDTLGAALLLSADPHTTRPTPLLSVDAEEAVAMLVRSGAWAALFCAPAGPETGAGAAFMADAVARVRPGPVLFAAPDAAPEALTAAVRVLLSADAEPPRGFGGFLYGYPAELRRAEPAEDSLLDAVVASATWVAEHVPLADRAFAELTRRVPGFAARTLAQAPNWASAAQRYLEGAELDQMRRLGSDVLLSATRTWTAPEADAARSDVALRTLTEIRQIVDDYLRREGR